jgi:hypothetical protein
MKAQLHFRSIVQGIDTVAAASAKPHRVVVKVCHRRHGAHDVAARRQRPPGIWTAVRHPNVLPMCAC